MIVGRTVADMLKDASASVGKRRVVLLCFSAGPGAQHDTAVGFLNEVSRAFGGRVMTASVSPGDDSELAREYAVAGTVTLVLFADGQEAARSVGGGGETMLWKLIERHAGKP